MKLMIKLTQNDFSSFVSLLSDLEEFRTETSRWRLIDDVLTGFPREKKIRGLLDLSGKPRPAAVSLINLFQKFGEVEQGKELTGILANRLLDSYVFDQENVKFLESLFLNYPLDEATVFQPSVKEWKGGENPQSVFEKIIGENTLRDIMLLELALDAAKAVVRIRTSTSFGSGFLCGNNMIMTNHHVIPDIETAQQAEFAFFYELNRRLEPKVAQIVAIQPNGLFFSNQILDVTIVQVKDVPDQVAPLELKTQILKKDSRVSIIQHPGGHYKKISIQNNFIQYSDEQTIQYTTSTEPGSSGSPVFNDRFEVVAIHHSGGMLIEPSSGRRYLRNAGSTMISILKATSAEVPDLHSGLNFR